MKTLFLTLAVFICSNVVAQKLPHGTIYGKNPVRGSLVEAAKLESFMGKRTRISVSISGTIINVTRSKGGWFTIDAGHGKSITAHFKNAGVNIPTGLKGYKIIAEGIAERIFNADDDQHYAGKSNSKAKSTKGINFEVTGLMVE